VTYPIVFDAENHQYYLNGVPLISVTQLMQKHGLAPSYDGVDPETLRKKAEYGTLVHKEIEEYINEGEIGFTTEFNNFALGYGTQFAPVKYSELMLHNDIVAGTCDLVLVGGIIADIKTTSVLHRDALSWQLSIYAALYELAFPDYPITRAQAFHFSPEGVLTVVDIPLKPHNEVLRLFECERRGEIYKAFDALPVTVAQMQALAEAENLIKSIEEQKKQAEAIADELRASLMKAMEQNGVTQFETEQLKVTYVAPTVQERIDTARLKKERPDIAEEFVKHTSVKASLRITLRKEDS
jgi:hypothetical protein